MTNDPAGRSGKVALVTGNACAYLGDLAANITGEALNVSGGQQMH